MALFASFAWVIVGVVYIVYRILKDEPGGCAGGIAVLLGISPLIMMIVGATMDSDAGESLLWAGLIFTIIALVCFIIWISIPSIKKNKQINNNKTLINQLKLKYNVPESFLSKMKGDPPINIYVRTVESCGSIEQKIALSKFNKDEWVNGQYWRVSYSYPSSWRDATDCEWKLLALETYGVSDFPQELYSFLYRDIKTKTESMVKKVVEAIGSNQKDFVEPWYFSWCSDAKSGENVLQGIEVYLDYSNEVENYPIKIRYNELFTIDGEICNPRTLIEIQKDNRVNEYIFKLKKLIESYCHILGINYQDIYISNFHSNELLKIARCMAFWILKKEELINVSDEQFTIYYKSWPKLLEACDPNRPRNLICKHRVSIDH